MVAKTYSATLLGLEALKIEIEVDGKRGVPGLEIIGLPSRAVKEAKERVTAALQNLGIRIKSLKTIVNLAPADLKKDAPHLELAIALGLLSLYGQLKKDLSQTLLLGELSLDGSLKPIRGAIPLIQSAQPLGFSQVIVPSQNQAELSFFSDQQIYHAHHLQEVIAWAQGYRSLPRVTKQPNESVPTQSKSKFDEVAGQYLAKRALLIAAAGGHHLLMTGPPGVGKTLLAESLPSLLPPLTTTQAMEVMAVHSLTHSLKQSIFAERPFRSPHHTASLSTLIGGGNTVMPGEITLAHQGILFLDELAEFPRSHLEALRQPLEAKNISFIKHGRPITYPSDFQLIAATNPCPCGFSGSTHHACTCSPVARQRYLHKLSGPILDRIDLHIFLEEPDLDEPMSESSELTLSDCQVLTREVHRVRTSEPLTLTAKAEKFLAQANHRLHFSARSHAKIISIAQTIAYLAHSQKIEMEHLAEAIQYRPG